MGSLVLHLKTLLLLVGETFRRAKVTNFLFGDENFARLKFRPTMFHPIRYVIGSIGMRLKYKFGRKCRYASEISNVVGSVCVGNMKCVSKYRYELEIKNVSGSMGTHGKYKMPYQAKLFRAKFSSGETI